LPDFTLIRFSRGKIDFPSSHLNEIEKSLFHPVDGGSFFSLQTGCLASIKTLEAISKMQITLKYKARADEKAEHTR
jgi:hypothetical protein